MADSQFSCESHGSLSSEACHRHTCMIRHCLSRCETAANLGVLCQTSKPQLESEKPHGRLTFASRLCSPRTATLSNKAMDVIRNCSPHHHPVRRLPCAPFAISCSQKRFKRTLATVRHWSVREHQTVNTCISAAATINSDLAPYCVASVQWYLGERR